MKTECIYVDDDRRERILYIDEDRKSTRLNSSH